MAEFSSFKKFGPGHFKHTLDNSSSADTYTAKLVFPGAKKVLIIAENAAGDSIDYVFFASSNANRNTGKLATANTDLFYNTVSETVGVMEIGIIAGGTTTGIITLEIKEVIENYK